MKAFLIKFLYIISLFTSSSHSFNTLLGSFEVGKTHAWLNRTFLIVQETSHGLRLKRALILALLIFMVMSSLIMIVLDLLEVLTEFKQIIELVASARHQLSAP